MISYLSLGANIGDRRKTLLRAIDLINEGIGSVVRQSKIMETDPVGFSSKNKFLNLCIAVDTALSPQELLKATQEIERTLGRTRKSVNQEYQDRTIDIDILLYGDLAINEGNLQIPHPRMTERVFVMKPLKEIMR